MLVLMALCPAKGPRVSCSSASPMPSAMVIVCMPLSVVSVLRTELSWTLMRAMALRCRARTRKR